MKTIKPTRAFFLLIVSVLSVLFQLEVKCQSIYTLTGTGNANAWNRNQYPIIFGNTCSRSTQLYTKAKLNSGGVPTTGTVELAKIAWHPDLNNVSIQGTLTIYIKHRPSSAGPITNASWDLTNAVTVYSGTVNHTTTQGIWWEVAFTQNFTWNNADDIQVLVEFTRSNSQGNPGLVWRGYDGNEPAFTTAFQVGATCPTTLDATFSPNAKFYDTRFTTAGSSPLTLGTITATQQTGNVTISSIKQGILRIDIPSSGSTGTLTLNSVIVTAANNNNADIATNGVKLWAGSTLATAAQLGTSQNFVGSTATFSGIAQSLTGITSLWVTYDIASGATLGNFVDAQIPSGGITITASGGATTPGILPLSALNPSGNRKIDYCDDLYNNGCTLSGINDVSIGTSGSVLNHTGTGCTGGTRFADFTNLPNINMNANQTYPFSILNVQATFVESGLGIWIDFNNNGFYNDAGEFVGSAYGRSTNNGIDLVPYTGNIVIPSVATGSYRMRIKLTDNLPQSIGTSCQKDNGGETHDYLINITGVSCTPPTASISPATASICSGQSTTLTASGGNTYLWSNGATTAAITISTAATYTVTVSNTGGCTATASRAVTANNTPTASISPATASICSGQTTTLTAGGGDTYLWSNGATTAAITISTAATYTVTVSNAGGCTATASRIVTANTTPTASISPATASICSGQTTILTADGGDTYLWSNGATTAAISVSSAATYTVTVSNAGGCSATANITVANTTPAVDVSGNASICPGQTTTLTATSVNNITDYQWQLNGNDIANADNNTFNASTAGNYSITVTDANGCTASSGVYTVTEDIPPIADFTFNVSGVTVTFSNQSQNATDYVWNFGDGSPENSDENTTHNYNTPGIYTVTLTAENSCGSDTHTEVIEILPVGIFSYMENSDLFKIYPNPAANELNIAFANLNNTFCEIKLVNVSGQVIYKTNIVPATETTVLNIDISELPLGNYFIQLNSKDAVFQKTITVLR